MNLEVSHLLGGIRIPPIGLSYSDSAQQQYTGAEASLTLSTPSSADVCVFHTTVQDHDPFATTTPPLVATPMNDDPHLHRRTPELPNSSAVPLPEQPIMLFDIPAHSTTAEDEDLDIWMNDSEQSPLSVLTSGV